MMGRESNTLVPSSSSSAIAISGGLSQCLPSPSRSLTFVLSLLFHFIVILLLFHYSVHCSVHYPIPYSIHFSVHYSTHYSVHYPVYYSIYYSLFQPISLFYPLPGCHCGYSCHYIYFFQILPDCSALYSAMTPITGSKSEAPELSATATRVCPALPLSVLLPQRATYIISTH